MPSATTIGRAPRYGSAAELASYAGLSVKTIRRMVDAGHVRGLKVGRRLVIPFEDLDHHALRRGKNRRPTMPPIGQDVMPRRSTDPSGRAIALDEHQARRRAEEGIQALDALDDMGDEDDHRRTLEVLERAEAEGRLAYRGRPG